MAMAAPQRGCTYTLGKWIGRASKRLLDGDGRAPTGMRLYAVWWREKILRCGSVLCAALVRASCKLSARCCSPKRNSPDERRSVDQKCHKPPGW